MLNLFAASTTTVPLVGLDAYDVVWRSPSQDAAGSMPLGNGEVVLNAWVEDKTGDLLILIARTDALSEISRVLKLGRVRIHLEGSPFRTAKDFEQRLHLADGVMRVSGGGVSVRLFVDSNSHVVHVRGESSKPIGVAASLELWRTEPRTLPKDEQGSAWSVHDAPFPLVESADVDRSEANAVAWYHRNETTVVPQVWENQSLTGLPGTFDPLLHRTFGGRIAGAGFIRRGKQTLKTSQPMTAFDLKIATHTVQVADVKDWFVGLAATARRSTPDAAEARTRKWWQAYWQRSYVFVSGDSQAQPIPPNAFPLRKGVDSNGGNVFPGEIDAWKMTPLHRSDPAKGFRLQARIRPTALQPGRIFDKMTAGGSDGFIFDMQGEKLRMIVGNLTVTSPKCLIAGEWQEVEATYDPKTGEAALFWNGRQVAHQVPEPGSTVTRGYLLQRYVQACQGRGALPIKFNGGYYCVEPTAMGQNRSPDWRNWGDDHWFQNVRHMYHPMLAGGDFEMMEPFFRLYEAARPLAESRTKLYHHVEGAYFPETMTPWGTYSGGDYGWDRTGKEPKDVQCGYWRYAWNQGPELVALMLDRWDYTRDEEFLKKRALPMAESVLRYFDTRFAKDAAGRIVLDPTQVVETYWHGVVNDMPSTAGLIAVTSRLVALPTRLTTPAQRAFFDRMRRACPELPLETKKGVRKLAPAQKYDPATSNCENGELYGVWPFRVVSLGHPALLAEAKAAYAQRLNHLDVGWGYDGNAAALLGMTDEAARILLAKCRNSRPGYRWPATWGPNFDWLPDQNHGGNLLHTTDLMLLQAEPMEAGGAIRLLPAWPRKWDVRFRLHAPGKTVVEGEVKGGKLVRLEVMPRTRRRDVILGPGYAMPKA